MALSRSYVRCSLCQGNVSIIAGNLDKLKSHLQNQHDVFHHLDFQIATKFLEDFEKEDIIAKLLPRMKVVFEGAKVPGKRSREESEVEEEAKKGRTEEDLNRDDDDKKEEGKIVYEDSSDDNFEIVTDENPEVQREKTSQNLKGQNVKEGCLKVEEEKDKDENDIKQDGKEYQDWIDGSKNEEGNGVETPSKPVIPRKSNRKSIQPKWRKTPTPTPTPRKESVVVGTKNTSFKTALTVCPRCQKEMLKRNIRRHLRVVHGQEAPSPPEQSLLLFKCKICSAEFASRDKLCLHTSQVHTLDIEDVEAVTLTEDNQGGVFEAVRDEINMEVIENSSGQGFVKDKLRSGK